MLAARQALAADPSQAGLSARLAAQIAALLAERAPLCVGFYWPIAGEFDARATLADWLAGAPGRSAALPVASRPDAPLTFRAWQPQAPMELGRHRIPVPREPIAAHPDLLLIPCLGFDAQRLRLGYGGGYYDRTLATLSPRPYTVGVAFECGRIALLPREAHDVALDVIVTETGRH